MPAESKDGLAHSPFRDMVSSSFYALLAADGFLGLGVLFWWLLSKKTTFVLFYSMYGMVPLYFWPYIILTLVSMILFGLNLAVAVYSWQHSGLRNVKIQGGNALGAFLGTLGSACPTCCAFLLSLLGVTTGVAALPFQGLELKLLSAVLLGISLWLLARKLAQHETCEAACEITPIGTVSPAAGRKDELLSKYLPYAIAVGVLFLISAAALPLLRKELAAASAILIF